MLDLDCSCITHNATEWHHLQLPLKQQKPQAVVLPKTCKHTLKVHYVVLEKKVWSEEKDRQWLIVMPKQTE